MKTLNLFPQAAATLTEGNRGNGEPTENLCSFRLLLSNGFKPFLCAAALELGILGHTTAQAQIGGVPLWTNHYNGSNGGGIARAVAVDRSGHVLVAGYSHGSGSGDDYATIKYSSAGEPLWTNHYNGLGNGDDVAVAVAVDGSGNVFVTGSSFSTIQPSADYPNSDYATIAYSSAGEPLWTNRYHGPSFGTFCANFPTAMTVDSSGNVVVTGYSHVGQLNSDYATIKYSGAGVPLWTNLYGRPANGSGADAVAVDGSGNVFVTGSSATIAYSGAGVPLWTNYSGGTAMSVDRSGNVLVTEPSKTIAYSGAGVPLWTNRYQGPGNGNDAVFAIAVDPGGNVFVTGWSSNPMTFPFYYNYDYGTIGYSGAGVPLWTNRYNGPQDNDDLASALAVDGNGNVFVTGSSTGTNGFSDFTTIKYSSAIPPSLAIARTTTNAVAISWPSPSPGFSLQQNTNGVATVNWSNVVTTPSDDGTTRTVILDPPTGSRFYRLFHP